VKVAIDLSEAKPQVCERQGRNTEANLGAGSFVYMPNPEPEHQVPERIRV